MHLAREGAFQLPGDVEAIEDRLGIHVELDLGNRTLGDASDHFADAIVLPRAVDDNALNIFGEEIAHRALNQVRLLKDAGGQRLFVDFFLNLLPFVDQQGEVADEVTFLLAFAHGANDDAHAFGNVEFPQDFFQAQAFLMIVDFARDAALIGIRQQHQVTPGQSQVGRHARAFGADGTFGHLHNDVAARRIKTRNVALRDAGLVAFAAFALDDFDAAVEVAGDDVPVVQEGVFLKADVHESGLQTVLEVFHLAFENAADETLVRGAFDGELFELARFEHCDARLQGLGVDDDLLVEFFDGLNQALDFFDDFRGHDFDRVHEALGRLFLDLNRLETGFLLFHFSGNGEVRHAEFALPLFTGFGRFRDGGSVGRQAGSHIFCALNFAFMTRAVEDRVFARFFPERFGAGFAGGAVSALNVGGHSAARAEPVAASTAAGKTLFTHKSIVSSIEVHVLQNARGDQRAEH